MDSEAASKFSAKDDHYFLLKQKEEDVKFLD